MLKIISHQLRSAFSVYELFCEWPGWQVTGGSKFEDYKNRRALLLASISENRIFYSYDSVNEIFELPRKVM